MNTLDRIYNQLKTERDELNAVLSLLSSQMKQPSQPEPKPKRKYKKNRVPAIVGQPRGVAIGPIKCIYEGCTASFTSVRGQSIHVTKHHFGSRSLTGNGQNQ